MRYSLYIELLWKKGKAYIIKPLAFITGWHCCSYHTYVNTFRPLNRSSLKVCSRCAFYVVLAAMLLVQGLLSALSRDIKNCQTFFKKRKRMASRLVNAMIINLSSIIPILIVYKSLGFTRKTLAWSPYLILWDAYFFLLVSDATPPDWQSPKASRPSNCTKKKSGSPEGLSHPQPAGL